MKLKDYQERTLTLLTRFLTDAQSAQLPSAFQALAEQQHDGTPAPSYRPIRGDDGQPLAALESIPYVALRIPTGGGKTVMGAHIIKRVADAQGRELPMVVWLVPTKTIKLQTLEAFQDTRHPYRRELDGTFGAGRVQVFDMSDIDHLRPEDLRQSLCLFIGTMASARVDDPTIRDFYSDKESLEPHFIQGNLPTDLMPSETAGRPLYSFANLLRIHRPIVITDEAHNATTKLSFAVYERLAPSAIIELTATPDLTKSNVLVRVSASELKAEKMIKLPVELKVHADGWQECLASALTRRKELEDQAPGEAPDYIRPILLIQAQNQNLEATPDAVRQHLIENERIDPSHIRVATGTERGLDGENLFDPANPIRIIITNQALREGWDCSFAYVLCSLAGTRSNTAIEQLLGRVLRMPYARERNQPSMERAYSHVVSNDFTDAAYELTDELEKMGFNPLEAAEAVQPDFVEGEPSTPIFRDTLNLTLPSAPNLAALPPEVAATVQLHNRPDGKVEVSVRGAVAEDLQAAILDTLPTRQQKEAKARLAKHNVLQAANRVTPAQQGEVFQIPQLCFLLDGEVVEASTDRLLEAHGWTLNGLTPNLRLSFDNTTRTFLIDYDGNEMGVQTVNNPSETFSRAIAGDWSEPELAAWIARQVRRLDLPHAEQVAWVARGVAALRAQGIPLDQLVRGKFILVRQFKLALDAAREEQVERVYQRSLLADTAPIVMDFAHTVRFDPLAYPKRMDCPAPKRWQKHYYAVPGDLPHRRASGRIAEEFQVAETLDSHPAVKFWVRNLVHPTQFWLPTAEGRTYPDFVAQLQDGRWLVVEHKGGDRVTNADSLAKHAIGIAWARTSGGRCIYLMSTSPSEVGGVSIDEQIRSALTQ